MLDVALSLLVGHSSLQFRQLANIVETTQQCPFTFVAGVIHGHC